jgi:hypothetical protein
MMTMSGAKTAKMVRARINRFQDRLSKKPHVACRYDEGQYGDLVDCLEKQFHYT